MQTNEHERARALVDQSAVEGIGSDDSRWLESHLAACVECSRFAELTSRAVGALGGFAFPVDSMKALTIEQTVRASAEQMAASPAGRLRALAFPIALGMTVAGSVGAWEVAQAMAAAGHWPPELWRGAFVAFWVLPSVIVDGVLLLRRRASEQEGGME